MVDKIINCKDRYISNTFSKFQKITCVHDSDKRVPNKYCINVKTKRRYVNHLVSENNIYGRVYDLSKKAKKDIDEYLKLPIDGYVYLDLDFKLD